MLSAVPAHAEPLTYVGESGPGQGKHIVLLAGDHEYRSEETLPALARILAQRHGFKCTVLFAVDPQTGEIDPRADNIPHTDVLESADLMVIFLRFKNLPDEQMQPIVDYLKRGGPVVGLRTSTHAFRIPADRKFARFDFRHPGKDYPSGFGRQVLGETWAGHYGKNHKMSTRLDLAKKAQDHPVLRGVKQAWVQAGGYWTDPQPDSTVLAYAQPLANMQPDAPPAEGKKPCPGVWVRKYQPDNDASRVFTTTYGASEDLLNDGFRRMLVNGCFWAVGLEAKITPELAIDFVGPYNPATFAFNRHRRQVRPGDLAGWTAPIMPTDRPTNEPKKPTSEK